MRMKVNKTLLFWFIAIVFMAVVYAVNMKLDIDVTRDNYDYLQDQATGLGQSENDYVEGILNDKLIEERQDLIMQEYYKLTRIISLDINKVEAVVPILRNYSVMNVTQ